MATNQQQEDAAKDAARAASNDVPRRVRNKRTPLSTHLSYTDLPDYLKKNEFVRSGYRR